MQYKYTDAKVNASSWPTAALPMSQTSYRTQLRPRFKAHSQSRVYDNPSSMVWDETDLDWIRLRAGLNLEGKVRLAWGLTPSRLLTSPWTAQAYSLNRVHVLAFHALVDIRFLCATCEAPIQVAYLRSHGIMNICHNSLPQSSVIWPWTIHDEGVWLAAELCMLEDFVLSPLPIFNRANEHWLFPSLLAHLRVHRIFGVHFPPVLSLTLVAEHVTKGDHFTQGKPKGQISHFVILHITHNRRCESCKPNEQCEC